MLSNTSWRGRVPPLAPPGISFLLMLGLAPHAVRSQAAPPPTNASTDAPSSDAASALPDESSGAVTPPVLKEQVDAVYPPQALQQGLSGTVHLKVTVHEDGSVGDVEVISSAGPELDSAAQEAVRRWRFDPARRGGLPIPSRIRVPFVFEPPPTATRPDADGAPLAAESLPAQPAGSALPSTSPTAPESQGDVLEVTVVGSRMRTSSPRGSSDVRVEQDVLQAAPRSEGSEVLRSTPGLYIGRGEGLAVAHNYMLRGFDAEHGQDIAFSVGGVPINLPSHIHGQGYADLSFLISDAVLALEVREGIYDPSQGDFAVAGSIDVELGVAAERRGTRIRSGYGSFGTLDQLLLVAPQGGDEEDLAAAHVTDSDGFGERRAGQSGSAIVQQRFALGEDTSLRLLGVIHGARADLAGVVRRDDVADGRVCFRCAYSEATAQNQSAIAQRVIMGVFLDHEGNAGDNGQLGLWTSLDGFRIQENFTGFLQRSRTLQNVYGRGDLIEQRNSTVSLGLMGRYHSRPMPITKDVRLLLDVGTQGRLDLIEQQQNLITGGVRNQTWDQRIDASVSGLDVGLHGDLVLHVATWLEARAGVRGDVLSYDIDDRLGNFISASRPADAFIMGYRRSAYGIAVGPRVSILTRVFDWLSLTAAYGQGYRSPQARTLNEGEQAPYTTVHSADLGARLDFGRSLSLALGGYYTQLSDDVAFDAEEGSLSRIGESQRMGLTASVVSRPWSFLTTSASLTTVRATLLEPPPPSAEDPAPPFVQGQRLPYVPPVVVRVDAAAEHALPFTFAGAPLLGNLNLGLSYLAARPLPYGASSPPFALLDAGIGVTYRVFSLSLQVFNALNTRYAAVEYNFPSYWDTSEPRSRIPARHTAAGAPRSFMAFAEVNL